jgi:CARDB
VTAPALAIGNPASISVGWTVTNVGTGFGQTGHWMDAIVLSADAVVGNGDDQILAEFPHVGGLAVAASYTMNEKVYLPDDASSRYHLFVVSDPENAVFENGAKTNDAAEAAQPLDVMPIPYADLVVPAVTADPSVQSGGPLHVSWTVANQGIGVTNVDSWADTLDLVSTSGAVAATYTFTHLGALGPGESYTSSADLAVPNGLSGNYRVEATTGGPFEFIYANNDSNTSASVSLQLAPSPDLIVSDAVVPSLATEGDFIDVSWTVSNQGQAAAVGNWTDNVQLRPLDQAGASPLQVGAFTHVGDLAPGQSYTRTERFLLPAQIQGVYQASIVTDSNDAVYEYGAAATNDQTTSANPLSVQLKPRPDLQVDSAVPPTTVPAGGTASMSFTIVNQGTVATTAPHWKDSVYLSLDSQFSQDDVLVGTYENIRRPQAP